MTFCYEFGVCCFLFFSCYSIAMARLHTVSDAGREGRMLGTGIGIVWFTITKGNEWTRTKNKKPTMNEEMHNGHLFCDS